MAALIATNTPRRHVLGDLVFKHYTLTGADGDTFTPPQFNIDHVSVTPTTTVAVGATVTNGIITFHAGGAWTADVGVFSREG